MTWFVVQLFIMESLTGIIMFFAIIVISLLYDFFNCKKRLGLRIGLVVLIILVPVSASLYVYQILKPMIKVETVDFSHLDKKTKAGNDYWHDTIHNGIEDGEYIGLYYCKKELLETWAMRSELPVGGKTLNGEPLESTLARYLTSKGLRKDTDGVLALTDEDIRNIENGLANYNNWKHPGLRARLSVTAFEYEKYKRSNNPNGGSISQRFEYTKASLYLIGKHLLLGVGTGDIPQAYCDAYNELNSPLQEAFRNRAHNQYLSITVGFGLVGLLWFLVVLLLPYLSSKKNRTYLYTVFTAIMLLSMLPEDTIESQAGVSLYTFFNALLLFAVPKDKGHETSQDDTMEIK
jgi:O-Antigen ligase.